MFSSVTQVIDLLSDEVKRYLYDIDGQKVFPIYGPSGGVLTSVVLYLRDPDNEERRRPMIPVEVAKLPANLEEELKKRIAKLPESEHMVDMDGGDMGRAHPSDMFGFKRAVSTMWCYNCGGREVL